MKYLKTVVLFLISLFILFSCQKSDEVTIAPTNLLVTTNISTDGSGKVVFTATADNAVSFDFEFGNGDVQTSSSGIVTYTYTLEGTNSYTVNVTARSSSDLSIKKTIDITVIVGNLTPGLFWSEEFNTNGAPDPTNWGYDIGAGGWGNSELQYYTNRSVNVIVEGGLLKIKAIKESYNGSEYTSTRLLSKDKFAFQYGRVEVRAKLPAGVGTWPAIWMLGSDISSVGWPACGEIDIMEHRGSELNKIFGTIHYPEHSGGNAVGGTTLISNATSEFHLYSVNWTASSMKFYVDDVLFFTVANSSSIPFNHNFFLILNIAMGGTFGGAVDPAFTNATMEVDYIRIYR